jgi:hypothetical protein
MTACTVFGVACGERDQAAYCDQYGRVTGAHSINQLTPDLPSDGVGVNLRHSTAQIGELVYGEVGADGRLRVVTVVDDGDWLVQLGDLAAHIYWSPELIIRGPEVRTRAFVTADSGELVGLALTSSPATLGAQPVTILAGPQQRR